jgi:hypothetical protein
MQAPPSSSESAAIPSSTSSCDFDHSAAADSESDSESDSGSYSDVSSPWSFQLFESLFSYLPPYLTDVLPLIVEYSCSSSSSIKVEQAKAEFSLTESQVRLIPHEIGPKRAHYWREVDLFNAAFRKFKSAKELRKACKRRLERSERAKEIHKKRKIQHEKEEKERILREKMEFHKRKMEDPSERARRERLIEKILEFGGNENSLSQYWLKFVNAANWLAFVQDSHGQWRLEEEIANKFILLKSEIAAEENKNSQSQYWKKMKRKEN